jgi:glycosyltransferase involved in cell wall biosynthesis
VRVLQLYTSTRSFFENQVTALEDRGVECTTLGVPGRHEAESPRSATDYLRYAPQVLGHSLRGYDLVHVNMGLIGPFGLAQPTRPVVLSLWGSDVMSDRGWLTRMSRFSVRHADEVILPSAAMSSAIDAEHTIIPFGIDLDRFRPIDRAAARERTGWDPDERVVLFPYEPGRPEKDYPRAERVIDRADTEADLRVVTGVPHEEIPYYMNASDALLLTSTRESGPMVVREAAACNLPVVATDVGFVCETLEGVANSHVCRTDEELVAGLEAVLEGGGGGRSDGREHLDDIGLETMGERLVEVYRRAIERREGTDG